MKLFGIVQGISTPDRTNRDNVLSLRRMKYIYLILCLLLFSCKKIIPDNTINDVTYSVYTGKNLFNNDGYDHYIGSIYWKPYAQHRAGAASITFFINSKTFVKLQFSFPESLGNNNIYIQYSPIRVMPGDRVTNINLQLQYY